MTAYKHGDKPVLGLIGGIGAGKSTAARLLETLGGRVIDADALGHEALTQPEVGVAVRDRWGPRVVRPNGVIDRRLLGEIVFADPTERAALEAIVFPYITRRCVEEIGRGQADPQTAFVVLDAALLLEAGWSDMVDRILYIDAPMSIRVQRVAERSGWDEAELLRRESAQWPAQQKRARADAVIENTGDRDALKARLHEQLGSWGWLPR